ncbi:MAG: MFS transporter [Myxococcota bacterium]|nr:MFS transporter [Myxococcota bacterium]
MTTKKPPIWHVLRSRPHFRRLWVSNIISLIGDWLSYIAVALISIEKGQGALAVAFVLVAHALPAALMSPITGPLADRFDRRRLIILGYIGATILTLGMWFAAKHNALVWLQICLFMRVCVSGIATTARSASVPSLVHENELHSANALLSLTWSIMFTTGLALGGLASAVLSPDGAILLDAATFLGAAWVVRGLPAIPPGNEGEARPRVGLRDLLTAWQFARSRPRVLVGLLGKVPAMAANGGGWIFLNIAGAAMLAPMDLAIALGSMQAARAIGTGVGPLLPAKIIPRSPLAGTILTFVGLAMFTYTGHVALGFIGLFVWGAGGGHNWVMSTVRVQTHTPKHLLGRMTAIDFFLFGTIESAAAIGAGILVDTFGIESLSTTVGLVAGGLAYMGLIAYWYLTRGAGDRTGQTST